MNTISKVDQKKKYTKSKTYDKQSRKEKSKKWWANTIKKLEEEKHKDNAINDEDIRKFCSPSVQQMLTGILFNEHEYQKIPIIQCEKDKDVKEEVLDDDADPASLEVRGSSVRFESDTSSMHTETLSHSLQFGSYGDLQGESSKSSRTSTSFGRQESTHERRRHSVKYAFDFEAFHEAEAEKIKVPESEYYNIYRSFMRKDPEMASVWKPKSKPPYEHMTLEQKADEMTNRIAEDFITWLRTLSPETTLTVDNIIKMFDIGGQTTLAKTFDLSLTQLTSISPNLTKLKNQPHMSRRHILNAEIKRDLQASKRKPKIFAFGSRLPATEQVLPETNDFVDHWVNKLSHGNLLTMEVTFKDIENLSSTKGFVKYLKTKPGVTIPPYLVKTGLMAKETLDDSELSSESTV